MIDRMMWFIIDLSEIRCAGPFITEDEALDFALAAQARGILYNFETYPSEKRTPEDALREWAPLYKQELSGGGNDR